MRWIKYLGSPHLVLQDADLSKAAVLIEIARRLWHRDYRDEGSVVIGAGVAVLYLPPRCRKPRDLVIIPSPGQGDGSRSVQTPINFLSRHGVPCFFECGRRD